MVEIEAMFLVVSYRQPLIQAFSEMAYGELEIQNGVRAAHGAVLRWCPSDSYGVAGPIKAVWTER